MFEIVTKKMLTSNICEMDVKAERLAKAAKPGQFLIVRRKASAFRLPSVIMMRRKGR